MISAKLVKYLSLILLAYLLLPAVAALMNVTPATVAAIYEKDLIDSFVVSISSAALTTVISAILGVPLAYFLARSESRWNGLFEAIIISPIVLPPLVTGLLLLSIFSPANLVGSYADKMGIPLTRSFFAVVLAQLAVASPFTIISAKAAFEEVDTKLEFASRLMGKSGLETFIRISLPLAKHGIIAGLMMTFVRSIGEFGATFMLAYFPKTLPIYLYTSYLGGGIERAAPIALMLWLLSLLFVVAIRLMGDGVVGAGRRG
jgi:molybdate/tungstate transport system permease protein